MPAKLPVSILATAIAFLAHAAPSLAERTPSRGTTSRPMVGHYVGAGATSLQIIGQVGGPELLKGGAGLSLFGGIYLGRAVELEFGWSATVHNPVRVESVFGSSVDHLVFNGFTFDTKLFVNQMRRRAPYRRFRPFVQFGIGAYLLDSVFFGSQSSGGGFQVGGGFKWEPVSSLELGASAIYRGVVMGPPAATYNDTFVSAIGLTANVGYRFN